MSNPYIFETTDDVPGWSDHVGYQVRRREDRKFLGYVLRYRRQPIGWVAVEPNFSPVWRVNHRQHAAELLDVQ